jgi:hypothetical protein
VGEIQVRVTVPPGQAGNLAGRSLVERFEDRVDELGDSIGEIANRLRERLDRDLAEPEPDKWQLDEAQVTFSLDLEVGAGVVMAQAKSTAGFEVALTWKRS